MINIDRFVADYVDAIRDYGAAVFAGAGLSIPAGLVDWRGLMREVAEDVGLNVEKESDLVSLAQYHVNESGGRHRINEALVTEFAERAELTENHRILASLPIRTYWTTNYDGLIENALRTAKKRVDVKHSDKNLAYSLRQRDVVVYKMHGDVSQPDEAVVTRDDYELYSTTRPLMASALQGDLVSKTFLFLGFSFSDPNLSYILGRIRVLLGTSRRDHYCLLRRVHEEDFETGEEFEYASIRQELQVKDLRRYGIQSVLLDEYAQYTTVLTRIADQFKRRRVFIGGSAADFRPLTPPEGIELLRSLGREVIESGFDLVNGFGVGVGPYLLNGALEGLGDTGSTSVGDRLVLRPFPQGIEDPGEAAARWRSYRKNMIGEAGIAIFLFGNKRNDQGEIVVADGVLEEFEIAREFELVIVPVAVTGHAAAVIYEQILRNPALYYDDPEAFLPRLASLAREGSPDQVVGAILETLNSIQRR